MRDGVTSPEHAPAHHAHQHHGDANRIQDVHAQQIAPRGPSPGDDVFLQAEQKTQSQNFRAAPDGRACDRVRRQALLAQFVGHQGKGNSRQKEKQRRRQRPTQLGPHEKCRLAGLGIQPGVVAVGLKHQDAGQAAHPVDVGETMCRRSRHALPVPTGRESIKHEPCFCVLLRTPTVSTHPSAQGFPAHGLIPPSDDQHIAVLHLSIRERMERFRSG